MWAPNIPLLEKVEQKVVPKNGGGFAPLFLKVEVEKKVPEGTIFVS